MKAQVVDIMALTKPRITLMTIIVAWGCMSLVTTAQTGKGILISLLGIGLLVSGSSALNMYLERDYDRFMERTKDRPLPAGRLAPGVALVLGLALSLAALVILAWSTNLLTVCLGFFASVSYVLIYTPLKRKSPLALFVGAVPGAMPALLGYTAASGEIDGKALALFAIAFFWQLPHFIAISLYRGEEYKKAGFPVVGNTWGLLTSKIVILFTTALLLLSSFSLWFLHVGREIYAMTSVIIGFWFLYVCYMGLYQEDVEKWSRRLFSASLYYQTILFASLALDVTFRSWIG